MQLKNTKNCIWKFFCLCVYQHNEAFKRRKQCRHRQWLELKHRPLLPMHKYAHFWKSSPRWRPQFPFFILLCCIGKWGAISAMHVQRMYNSATYFQLKKWNRAWTFDPWPNPTRPGHFLTRWLDRSLSVCALNWEIILMTVCYKWTLSAAYAAHTRMTKISNIIVSLFSIEK